MEKELILPNSELFMQYRNRLLDLHTQLDESSEEEGEMLTSLMRLRELELRKKYGQDAGAYTMYHLLGMSTARDEAETIAFDFPGDDALQPFFEDVLHGYGK